MALCITQIIYRVANPHIICHQEPGYFLKPGTIYSRPVQRTNL